MRWALALLLAFAGCPCGGNSGVIRNARPNAAFALEPAELYVSTSSGIERVSLDGLRRTKIFAKLPHPDVPQVTVVDVSLDQKIWLLSDSHTNLWIGDPATGAVREVKELHHRMASAAISPDGKTIAASRHSDYSGFANKPNDDGVYLIDIATGKVDTIPKQTENWPTRVEWADDGSALWLTMAWEKPSQWITLADRKRREIAYDVQKPTSSPAPLRANPRRPTWTCPYEVRGGRDPELTIVDLGKPEQAARVLVRLEGRERGFHDYLPDFEHPQLTPRCEHVVFQHRRQVWVTDLAGTQAGPIVDGEWLWFAPTSPPAAP